MEISWGKIHGFPLKPWSRSKIPWFSWRYFHAFHAFHASMGQENCKNIPHEYKTTESMGIYKHESMESMVLSSILLSIISRKNGKHGKHGKHGKIAWEKMEKTWNLCK